LSTNPGAAAKLCLGVQPVMGPHLELFIII